MGHPPDLVGGVAPAFDEREQPGQRRPVTGARRRHELDRIGGTGHGRPSIREPLPPAQLIAGRTAFNADQIRDLKAPLGWGEYLAAPDFWSRTFQNWQSEFLAVGSMVVLAIYLRERGSPESKPVGAPHGSTGVEG